MRTFHPFCYSHFTILFYGYIYNWQRDVKLHTKKLKTFAKKTGHMTAPLLQPISVQVLTG